MKQGLGVVNGTRDHVARTFHAHQPPLLCLLVPRIHILDCRLTKEAMKKEAMESHVMLTYLRSSANVRPKEMYAQRRPLLLGTRGKAVRFPGRLDLK